MVVDLTNAFNLPGSATNITYGDGDCAGDNIPAFPINPVNGQVDFTGATAGVALWYFVTFDLPGDNLSCSPNNCRDISVTPIDPLNIEYDEATDAFVDSYYHVCSFNAAFTMDDTDLIDMVAVFKDPAGIGDVVSPFDGTYTMDYTEWGSATIYNLCSGSFVAGASFVLCSVSQAQIAEMINYMNPVNSSNNHNIVSGITLTASVTPVGSYTTCSDTDTVGILFMPVKASADVADIDCTAIPAVFGTTEDFDLYNYLKYGGVNLSTIVNSDPTGTSPGAYGEGGDWTWILTDVPLCIMAQLDFGEVALTALTSTSFEVSNVPLVGSSMRHLNTTICDVDGTITFTKDFTFTTGYSCSEAHTIDYITAACAPAPFCYDVSFLSDLTDIKVDLGAGPVSIIGDPEFVGSCYGECDFVRPQFIADLNTWLTANGFSGTATLLDGVMGVGTLRIVDTTVEFISITQQTLVYPFTQSAPGCAQCGTETFFFDEFPEAGKFHITQAGTGNFFTDLILARFPDVPLTGTFVVDADGGGLDTCGTADSNYTGTFIVTNNVGFGDHGDYDANDLLAGDEVTIGYEFTLPSNGCDYCIAIYVEIDA